MVTFCKKNTTTPLQFRRPQKADFLGSKFREFYLLPIHEIDVGIFQTPKPEDQQILHAGNTDAIRAYHLQSAIEHWKLMRIVLPAEIWENW
jgi:hypothetical protein